MKRYFIFFFLQLFFLSHLLSQSDTLLTDTLSKKIRKNIGFELNGIYSGIPGYTAISGVFTIRKNSKIFEMGLNISPSFINEMCAYYSYWDKPKISGALIGFTHFPKGMHKDGDYFYFLNLSDYHTRYRGKSICYDYPEEQIYVKCDVITLTTGYGVKLYFLKKFYFKAIAGTGVSYNVVNSYYSNPNHNREREGISLNFIATLGIGFRNKQ